MNSLRKLWESRKAKTKDEQKQLTSATTEETPKENQTGHSSNPADNMNESLQNVKYGSFMLNHTDGAKKQPNTAQEQRNKEQIGLCGETGYTNLALTSDSGNILYNDTSSNHRSENHTELLAKKRKNIPDKEQKLTIFIERDSYHQKEFNYNYGREDAPPENLVKKVLKDCKCSPLSVLFSIFPVLSWLPKYNIKENLLSDVITGFTLAILQIPQGMAYGLMASVGAINGLYVSFFPVIAYFLMGTSRHVSIGTFAVISIMVSNAVSKLGAVESRSTIDANVTMANNTEGVEEGTMWPPTKLEVVMALAMIVGFIQIGMGILRLGAVSVVLSDQLISGFTTGAATYVATSQLRDLFGIKVGSHKQPLQLVYIYIDIFKALPESNAATVIVSAISLFSLAVVKEQINERFRHKLIMPLPIDLFVTIAVTVASYYMDLAANYNVSIMGDIPTGLPAPSLPRLDVGTKIIPDCISIGIVVFAITLSLGKLFAKKHGYTIRPNQELIALGSSNLFSSFFSCFPCAVSLSRSMVVERTGGKSQIAALISCLFILVVLLFLAPLFYYLPKCILSCIILVALKGMFLQFKDLWAAWKVSRIDAVNWMVIFLAVVIIGIDIGLLFGVMFSLAVVLLRIVFPTKSLLGSVPNTEIYVSLDRYKESIELNGIKIFYFGGTLCYLNKEVFKSFILENVSQVKSKQVSNSKNGKLPSFVRQKVSYAILDCSSFGFLDLSGKDMLLEIGNELKEEGITLILAECSVPVYEMLEKTGYVAITDDGHPNIFPTVHDAVVYCQSTYNTRL